MRSRPESGSNPGSAAPSRDSSFSASTKPPWAQNPRSSVDSGSSPSGTGSARFTHSRSQSGGIPSTLPRSPAPAPPVLTPAPSSMEIVKPIVPNFASPSLQEQLPITPTESPSSSPTFPIRADQQPPVALRTAPPKLAPSTSTPAPDISASGSPSRVSRPGLPNIPLPPVPGRKPSAGNPLPAASSPLSPRDSSAPRTGLAVAESAQNLPPAPSVVRPAVPQAQPLNEALKSLKPRPVAQPAPILFR
jgi:hypothetical protein